jgi:hypothetical protein
LGNDSNNQEFEKKPPIIALRITDNGVGFIAANWDSFNLAHSSYEYVKGGKGIGRITWLRAFKSVHIDSIYRNDGH